MIVPGDANPLLMGGADGYQISRSVRLRSSASAYFNRTPASASNRKTWTWSAWVKRGQLGSANNLFCAGTFNDGVLVSLQFNSDDTFTFYCDDGLGPYRRTTTQVYRDWETDRKSVV